MNIEAYDTESLRRLVRKLQYENSVLKEKLNKSGIPFEKTHIFEDRIENNAEYDPDQAGRIINPDYINDDMARRFFSMFWGREDVFAKRGKNGGYFPQCKNRWDSNLCPKQRGKKTFCDECENVSWIRSRFGCDDRNIGTKGCSGI